MLDLLIKNGHVIDPKNNVNEIRSIAIYNGRLVPYLPEEEARHVIDAKGKFVFLG